MKEFPLFRTKTSCYLTNNDKIKKDKKQKEEECAIKRRIYFEDYM